MLPAPSSRHLDLERHRRLDVLALGMPQLDERIHDVARVVAPRLRQRPQVRTAVDHRRDEEPLGRQIRPGDRVRRRRRGRRPLICQVPSRSPANGSGRRSHAHVSARRRHEACGRRVDHGTARRDEAEQKTALGLLQPSTTVSCARCPVDACQPTLRVDHLVDRKLLDVGWPLRLDSCGRHSFHAAGPRGGFLETTWKRDWRAALLATAIVSPASDVIQALAVAPYSKGSGRDCARRGSVQCWKSSGSPHAAANMTPSGR